MIFDIPLKAQHETKQIFEMLHPKLIGGDRRGPNQTPSEMTAGL